MQTTRELPIDKKIFSKIDLKKFSKIFTDELKSCEDTDAASMKFKFTFSDNSTIETDSIAIFEDDSIIYSEKCIELDFDFYNYSLDKYVNLKIMPEYPTLSKIRIRGNDDKWIGYITNLFENTLKQTKPQNNFLLRHVLLIRTVLSLFMGYITFMLIKPLIFFLASISEINPSPLIISLAAIVEANLLISILIGLILILFSFYLIGYGIVDSLLTWLLKLWPSIEFDFGPEYLNTEKERRKRLWIFSSIFLLPFLMSFFT